MVSLQKPLFAWIFFSLWLFLSGHTELFLICMGAVIALLLAWLSPNLPRIGKHWFGWFRYAPWLLGRIILANIHVARLIIAPKLKLSPRIFKHKTTLNETPYRVLLGQSITLTPGTITVSLKNESDLLIHGIDTDSTSDLTKGRFEKVIKESYALKEKQ